MRKVDFAAQPFIEGRANAIERCRHVVSLELPSSRALQHIMRPHWLPPLHAINSSRELLRNPAWCRDVRDDLCAIGSTDLLHDASQLHMFLPAHAIMLPFARLAVGSRLQCIVDPSRRYIVRGRSPGSASRSRPRRAVISHGVLVTTAPGGDVVRLSSPAMSSFAPTSGLPVLPAKDHSLQV